MHYPSPLVCLKIELRSTLKEKFTYKKNATSLKKDSRSCGMVSLFTACLPNSPVLFTQQLESEMANSINRLSSQAAAAGPLPVCLWLLSWWHCKLPGKVEGHSCLCSFIFSMSRCYSQIISWDREPTEYPVTQKTLVLHRLHTRLRSPELGWWLCNQLVQALKKRLCHLVAISPQDWTPKPTVHVDFRHWGFSLLIFIWVL